FSVPCSLPQNKPQRESGKLRLRTTKPPNQNRGCCSPSILSPTISLRFIVHCAYPMQWRLALQIGCGKYRPCCPLGTIRTMRGQYLSREGFLKLANKIQSWIDWLTSYFSSRKSQHK